MGLRGPPPEPSEVKKANGTYRADRAARNEVKAKPGVPKCPAFLKGEARKEWARVVPHLEQLGILSEIDQGRLADYCAAHALAVDATKKYTGRGKDGGLMVTINGSQRVRNPLLKIAQEARAQARLLGQEFGLTPSARSRISAPDKDAALASSNQRIKDTASGATAEAKAADNFFNFERPKLVKPGT